MAYIKQNYKPGDVLTSEQVNKIQDTIIKNEGNIDNHIEDKNNPHGVTAIQVGAAPAGLVYETLNIETGTDEELMKAIDEVFAQMEDKTVRFVVAIFGEMHPVLGGGNWLIRIYRSYEKYGSIECSSFTTREHERYLRMGVWSDWVWVNPPMTPGVEYLTTKMMGGNPVYQKTIGFGALPDGTSDNVGVKEVDCGVHASKVISISGYAYKDGETNPLPMGSAGKLAAYHYVVGTKIGITTMQALSSYQATFLIEYQK